MSETTTTQVVFAHPFSLPGMDGPHPPGTFDLLVEREPLDLPFPAFRLSVTIMLSAGTAIEAWAVARADLDAALAADRAQA